ncbi:hypothetical protein Scep_003449 [Stephania cephalantha]|uniref:Uncharacterized protein n=1 Tax=Stephania cephalantha TaxID=152367 RepID=A0AAP0KRG2_9MAGN
MRERDRSNKREEIETAAPTLGGGADGGSRATRGRELPVQRRAREETGAV